MKVTIPDAIFPDENHKLIVDDEGVSSEILHLHAQGGSRIVLLALDFYGAAALAEVLIPFLRNHPEREAALKSTLEG